MHSPITVVVGTTHLPGPCSEGAHSSLAVQLAPVGSVPTRTDPQAAEKSFPAKEDVKHPFMRDPIFSIHWDARLPS
jgi:hypothetical protein